MTSTTIVTPVSSTVRSLVPGLLVLASLACGATSAASDATPPKPVSPTPSGSGAQPAPAPTSGTTTGEDKPQLGIQIDERAPSFDANKGLPILHVVPGSTAAAMGVQIGDRITAINGSAVTKSADLQKTLSAFHIGDPITLEVVRGEDRKSLSGTMQRAPNIHSVQEDLQDAKNQIEQIKQMTGMRGKREPSLADIVQTLDDIEKQLPKAVAEFKKQYPKGDFDISIKVRIVSDRTAKDPVDLVPDGDDTATGTEATKDAGKGAGVDRSVSGHSPGDRTPPAAK